MTNTYDPRYPEGLDWSWGAVDRDGHVGLFITAGWGPMPIREFEGGFQTDLGPEELMNNLPITSDFQLFQKCPDPSSFTRVAERGVFVYDWGKKYCLAARPVNPITIDQCPAGLRTLLKVQFDQTSFGGESIDVETMFDCFIGKWMRW